MKIKQIAALGIVAFVLAALGGFAAAQGGTTTPPAGSSLSFVGGSGNCDTPGPGKTVFCGAAALGTVMISVNGGPFADVKGAPGAAGPQGPAGPAGTVVSLNGKTCTATFDGMTQDGKGSGTLILHLGTCQ
jgi:hypothetical protein